MSKNDLLSKEQLLLLNQLTYLPGKEPFLDITSDVYQGGTLGDYIDAVYANLDQIPVDGATYDGMGFTSNEAWRNIVTAIHNDPELRNLELIGYDRVNGDTELGYSLGFGNPETGEAVVAYRGTSGHEWKDNFTGGGRTECEDGVSTPQQEDALDAFHRYHLDGYDTITVTGHSKGGNKAKYITIMDDSVDRCVSFDGQGFSDEFLEHHQDKIALNQGKISNHNASGDYVNFLLNDVGESTYYEPQDVGKGGFLENHSPDTLMTIGPDGQVVMVETEQDPRIVELNHFLNSYLRSMPEDQRAESLALIGEIVEQGFERSGEGKLELSDANDLIHLLLEDNNLQNTSYLMAYLLKYKETYPDFLDSLYSLLDEMGLSNVSEMIRQYHEWTENGLVQKVPGALEWILGAAIDIDDFFNTGKVDELLKELRSQGIYLSKDELKKLLKVLGYTTEYMDSIKVSKNRGDHSVQSYNIWQRIRYEMVGSRFHVTPELIMESGGRMKDYSARMKADAEEALQIANDFGFALTLVKFALRQQIRNIENTAKAIENCGDGLEKIGRQYKTTEGTILGNHSY